MATLAVSREGGGGEGEGLLQEVRLLKCLLIFGMLHKVMYFNLPFGRWMIIIKYIGSDTVSPGGAFRRVALVSGAPGASLGNH